MGLQCASGLPRVRVCRTAPPALECGFTVRRLSNMPKAIDIRKGQAVIWEDKLWIVHESTRVAKGNWRSYMQLKFKNFKTGQIVDNRFNMDENFESPHVEDRPFEYLYKDGDNFILMDVNNFEQIHASAEIMPDADKYLKGNERVSAKLMDGQVIGVELPNVVELTVTDAPPVVKGATATNQSKEATLETGLVVRVPPFIVNGEVIRVDTRTGEYLERA
ncbi:MAG: elongation factor P [Planctomycetes bacterium UTPLA1]|nr:MAG: elongation factor P [Planctomycetes bacterium UTPLA1]